MSTERPADNSLSYLEIGDSSADPLVLVSGAGSTKESWGELAPALAEHFRVICFDCPGLGGSAPPADRLDTATLADRIAALLDDLGITAAPVLVVAGEQDTLAPPRFGRQVSELVADGRFELFTGPGSSHALGLERSAEFVPLVRDFLARHPLPVAL